MTSPSVPWAATSPLVKNDSMSESVMTGDSSAVHADGTRWPVLDRPAVSDASPSSGKSAEVTAPPTHVIPPAPRVLGTSVSGVARAAAPQLPPGVSRTGAAGRTGLGAVVATGKPRGGQAPGPSGTRTATPMMAAGIDGRSTARHRSDPSPPDGVRIVAPTDLRRAAELLREDVAQLTLPLETDGVHGARRELNSLLSQLDDYLLPRLRRIDAPLLAVVGGSTGAGKSTLVNSLVRRVVTRSGVLRPTTRSPVLIHHPYDSGAFLTQRILPGFARVTSEAPEPLQPIDVNAPRATALRLVPDEGLAPGLAIIDAPDIDSLVETNRDLAIQLLAAADLWVFVTTAARYCDAVPWDMLRTAVDRGASVAVVLDRVPVVAMNEVRVHLAQLLRDRGLSTAPLFTIPETAKGSDGFLPEEVVAPLHGWLGRLARDSRSRDVVVRRTLAGALESLRKRVRTIAAAAEKQVEARAALATTVTQVFDDAARELPASFGGGGLLRGEIQARWHEYLGGEAFRGLDGTMVRLRGRVTAAVTGRSTASAPLSEAVRTGVRASALTILRSAVERTADDWRRDPHGTPVLRQVEGLMDDAVPGRTALGERTELRVARAVQDWQTGVLELVRAEGQGRWRTAGVARLGVDGTAVVLALAALGSTSATPGPIAEVAGRVLHAALGDRADALASAAHADIVRRVSELLATEQQRFLRALDGAGVRDDLAVALRTHVRAIERAR